MARGDSCQRDVDNHDSFQGHGLWQDKRGEFRKSRTRPGRRCRERTGKRE